MKNIWAQPSLSRDFALLAAAIVCVLLVISTWVTYVTYTKHSRNINLELEKEAIRIEQTIAAEMGNASYMLMSLGRNIVLNKELDLVKLAQLLKSFDSKGHLYAVFSWINTDQQVVVSSNKGVLEKPVAVSDRDYITKTQSESWKMQIGRPIEGRVSGRWIIPVAMGITDYTGKFIGTIMISLDINLLTDLLSKQITRSGLSFSIASKTLIPLTQAEDEDASFNHFPIQKLANIDFSTHPHGLITEGSLFWGVGSYSYYHISQDYPYITLLNYDVRYSDEIMRSLLWSRLLQIVVIATFFVLFLFIVRARMIRPVVTMTEAAAEVAKGHPFMPFDKGGPIEIENLAAQIGSISQYIDESKRIENELRNKMFMLKKNKEIAEMNMQSTVEFLAYVSQEMRVPVNNILGFAQVMKDQLYGPIENKKYRQYAADIYRTSNNLLNNLEDLLVFAKHGTGYIILDEKPIEVRNAVEKALRFVAEKMQPDTRNIQTKLPETLPRLIANEFRIQQIIANILLYVFEHALQEQIVFLEIRVIRDSQALQSLICIISTENTQPISNEAVLSSLEQNRTYNTAASPEAHAHLNLELAKLMVTRYGGTLVIHKTTDNISVILGFNASRLHTEADIDTTGPA